MACGELDPITACQTSLSCDTAATKALALRRAEIIRLAIDAAPGGPDTTEAAAHLPDTTEAAAHSDIAECAAALVRLQSARMLPVEVLAGLRQLLLDPAARVPVAATAAAAARERPGDDAFLRDALSGFARPI